METEPDEPAFNMARLYEQMKTALHLFGVRFGNMHEVEMHFVDRGNVIQVRFVHEGDSIVFAYPKEKP
jgi:hypothetical protein